MRRVDIDGAAVVAADISGVHALVNGAITRTSELAPHSRTPSMMSSANAGELWASCRKKRSKASKGFTANGDEHVGSSSGDDMLRVCVGGKQRLACSHTQ